jgi:bifunctional non-homologous end joining protein LigD
MTVLVPADRDNAVMTLADRTVRLTNLRKIFWPDLGVTKGDLLQYYADVAPVLLPHTRDRAMVMRRYPDGAAGTSFFMKQAPSP